MPPSAMRGPRPSADVPSGPARALTFAAVYAEHARTVARWAARLGGPSADVEDLTQEVFLVVNRRLADYRGEAASRRGSSASRRRSSPTIGGGASSGTVVPLVPSAADARRRRPTARSSSSRSASGACSSTSALDRLSERHRRALVLFELEELPTDEIAELMQLSVGNVRVLLHRARAAFLKAMVELRAAEGAEMRAGESPEETRGAGATSSTDPSALPARAADLVEAAQAAPPCRPRRWRACARTCWRGGPRARAAACRWAAARDAAAIVLASVATASGAVMLWRRYVAAPAPTDAATRARAATRERRAPVVERASAVARASSSRCPRTSPRNRRRRRAPTDAPRRGPAARAGRGRGSRDARRSVLWSALAELRQARDPRGALAMLDEYRRPYPRGVLQPEALRARLEAVLAARRSQDGARAARRPRHGVRGAPRRRAAADARRAARERGPLRATRSATSIACSRPASSTLPPTPERALYGRAVTPRPPRPRRAGARRSRRPTSGASRPASTPPRSPACSRATRRP